MFFPNTVHISFEAKHFIFILRTMSLQLYDIFLIVYVIDSLLVFEGEGGKKGNAVGPLNLRKGMNKFLSDVDVTFRRDHDSKRPRINKAASRKDREQRTKGDYYSFDS